MTSGNSSRRPVTGKNTEWMIPSDQMIIRRYKPLRHFADTLENGFRAGQAEGYEEREGQASEPARDHERQRSERTESMILKNGEEMDLASGMEQAGEAARENYYASCWRLGTDEDPEIWETYAGGRGVAIETTYRQIEEFIAPDQEDLYMGIVRYLDYEEEFTPTGIPYVLYFYKHRTFDSEQEFRVLTNRGGNPIIRTDGQEMPPESRPDNPSHVNLSADMDTLINRVILSPGADDELRAEVEETLNEHGVSAPVVPSRLDDPAPHHETYDTELGGAANYEASKEYLDDLVDRFVEETDWEVWNTVDVIQLNQREKLHPRTVFVECFRYVDDPPDRSEYGQEHLNYEVRAHRVVDGEYQDTFLNDPAEETDEELAEADNPSE
ncbi:hypothetical protein [Halorubrum sp. SP9]|uniref:hypothetical protein n=1 Tax=Halorubrum sp. SP9 TaxID=1537267 RepID=UPI0010FA005E|nr:hypothetical protein [Halorubrum sp. SP9]